VYQILHDGNSAAVRAISCRCPQMLGRLHGIGEISTALTSPTATACCAYFGEEGDWTSILPLMMSALMASSSPFRPGSTFDS